MKKLTAIHGIFSLILLLSFCQSCNDSNASAITANHSQEAYQCMPCGSDCDKKSYTEAGNCSSCNMKLVKKSTVNFKSIPPSAICDYIKKHPDAVLLDVRTAREFEGKSNPKYGTLKNAINVPVQELESRLASIGHLKDKEVLVYCSHSQRSPRASYFLMQHGFTNVTNMDGGMSEVTDKTCLK